MKIGIIEFDPAKLPWRMIVGGIAGGIFLGFLGYAWFQTENRELMQALNVVLKYNGTANEAALWEAQLGARVHGAVVALCAKYPWVSPIFGYRDSHTAQMLSYIYHAYKANKAQLMKAAWLYETDAVPKAGTESKYQSVLEYVYPEDDRPDPKYTPAPLTAWEIATNYVMPIASFALMLFMVI